MAAPPTLQVFNILRNQDGTPVVGAPVTCTFTYNQATVAATGDAFTPQQQSTTTDANGRYVFTIVGNDLVSPSGTVYDIKEPTRTYQIAPQSTNGSLQQTTAANVIVNTPSALTAPNFTGTGPFTVTGLLTAQAGEVISGGTGATLNASGDLAVRSLTASTGVGPYTPIAVPGNIEAVSFNQWGNGIFSPLSKQNPSGAADPTGAADATASLQAAATAAGAVNGILLIPPGTYSITSAGTECLLITHPIHMVGYGYSSVLQVKSTTGATVDVIHVKPATATTTDATMYLFEDFRITAQSGTPARHAFNLDTSTGASFIRRSRIHRIWTDQFGGNAIQGTNSIAPGPFTMTIDDNFLFGGVVLNNSGDSVVICDNTITGTGQITVTNLSAAGQCIIERNNITCSGGINVTSAVSPRIRQNNCQINVAFTGQNSAFINLSGSATQVLSGEVSDNLIAILAGSGTIDAIRIGVADRVWVTGNYIGQVAGANGLNISASATNTFVAGNRYTGAGTNLLDSGTNSTILDQNTSKIAGTLNVGGLLQVLSGGFTLVAGQLTISAAPAQIVMQGAGTAQLIGGTTGIAINNNANTVQNLLLNDTGELTLGASLGRRGVIFSQTTAPTVASPGSGVTAQSVIAGGNNTELQVQATLTAIAPGVVIGVVTFNGAPLTSAPKAVVCSLSAPTAGVAAPPIVGADTYTTSGFTLRSYGPTTVTTGTYIITCHVFF